MSSCVLAVRLEWDCACGAWLTTEAWPSRTNPYAWDCPWAITCRCMKVHGIKLTAYAGRREPVLSVCDNASMV